MNKILNNSFLKNIDTHVNLLLKKGKYFEMWKKQELN